MLSPVVDGESRRAGTKESQDDRLAREVRDGLSAALPTVSSAYLYDDHGSHLFDEITRLPEYYQTRTEEALLDEVAQRVLRAVQPRELVELGSGVGRKIRTMLDALTGLEGSHRCVLFDINERFLRDSMRRLAVEYPDLEVAGVHGDFRHDLPRLGPGGSRLVMFLGGTLGNIHPDGLAEFLRNVACQLAPGDGFLVGVDLVKDKARLEEAYNDRAGVTSAFNLNILNVLNRELDGDFDPEAWEHRAFFDTEHAWIEMRLRSLRSQRVALSAIDFERDFARGDEIRTEISAKYTRESLQAHIDGTGLVLDQWHTDPEQLFALVLLRRPPRDAARA
ncbi:MAG: L-histidine N(alpha)-methyltransferase [Planctomycetota bacterium]|jgi:L-histidine N-alpha-methyltransferase